MLYDATPAMAAMPASMVSPEEFVNVKLAWKLMRQLQVHTRKLWSVNQPILTKPEHHNPNPRTRNPKLETRNPEPETRTPEPETRTKPESRW